MNIMWNRLNHNPRGSEIDITYIKSRMLGYKDKRYKVRILSISKINGNEQRCIVQSGNVVSR